MRPFGLGAVVRTAGQRPLPGLCRSACGRLDRRLPGRDRPLARQHLSGHRDAAGVYFAYGQAAVNVDGLVTNAAATGYLLTRTGSLTLNACSAGAYWTHYGPGGWYLDAILQETSYQGSATTQFAQLPTDGHGFISSLEAGYPIPLPFGPHFVLEPQAQMRQQVTFDDANESSVKYSEVVD